MRRQRRYKGRLTPAKVMKSVKKLRRDLNPMIDHYDKVINATAINVAGAVTDLTDVTARVDGEEALPGFRDGDTIQAKNLLLRGSINWDTEALGPTAMIRMIVLMKKQDNDQALTVLGNTDSSILEDFTVGDTLDVLAPLSWHARTGIKVLSDDLLIGNPDSIDNIVFKKYFKFNHQVKYTANNGMARGNIYILFKSNETTNPPILNIYSRFKYTQNL